MKLHLERKIKGENHFDKAKAFQFDLLGIKWHRGFFHFKKLFVSVYTLYIYISVRTIETRTKCWDYPNIENQSEML